MLSFVLALTLPEAGGALEVYDYQPEPLTERPDGRRQWPGLDPNEKKWTQSASASRPGRCSSSTPAATCTRSRRWSAPASAGPRAASWR